MFRIFKRKEDKFQKLIEQQASLSFDGLRLLVKYLETGAPDVAEELSLKEKEADEVRRILIDELNRTFVTPFDREDIFALSRSIAGNGLLAQVIVDKFADNIPLNRQVTRFEREGLNLPLSTL